MRNFKQGLREVRDGQAKLLRGQTSMGKATGFLVESFVRRGVAELEGEEAGENFQSPQRDLRHLSSAGRK